MPQRYTVNKSHVGPNVQTPFSSLHDDKVKVTSADTTTGYLNSKITPGVGIYTAVLNPAGNEELEVASMKQFTLVDGANIAVDASLGNVATVTIAGNRALANPTNPTAWQLLMFVITQGVGGSHTLSYGADYIFGTTLPTPVLSTTAGKKDYLGFLYNPVSTKWHYLAEAFGL